MFAHTEGTLYPTLLYQAIVAGESLPAGWQAVGSSHAACAKPTGVISLMFAAESVSFRSATAALAFELPELFRVLPEDAAPLAGNVFHVACVIQIEQPVALTGPTTIENVPFCDFYSAFILRRSSSVNASPLSCSGIRSSSSSKTVIDSLE